MVGESQKKGAILSSMKQFRQLVVGVCICNAAHNTFFYTAGLIVIAIMPAILHTGPGANSRTADTGQHMEKTAKNSNFWINDP